ncbi:hypothetical protein OF83DRAFT_1054909 [Amylostereum chailletii]|nr:hypothetical protein OF83DRAFT_1054909 [Amylostereum chailletii]
MTFVYVLTAPSRSVCRASSNEHQFLLDPASLDTPLDRVCESNVSTPCPHELWTVLDLEYISWTRYDRFTLRLSWPASSPADFSITFYTPFELAALFSHSSTLSSSPLKTCQRYARIRVAHTGVRPPAQRDVKNPPVPFVLILDPLYLGVMPASVAPVLALLSLLIPIAWTVSCRVADGLEGTREKRSGSGVLRKASSDR